MANIEQLAYQALDAAGTQPVTAVYTVGGGAKNTVWQSIRQQTMKIPVSTPNHTESAYGSALIAQGYIDSLLAKNKMDKH
jgi:sugar (pentulose or hexulose) kinase